jgi:pyrroline-5-carboxylate reductase
MAMSASSGPSSQTPELRDLSGSLVLVGAGKMGSALLEGWLRFGLDPKKLTVIEPAPSQQVSALVERGLRLNPERGALTGAAAIVIAVKPQVAPEIVPGLAPMLMARTMVVSIMAGRTLKFLATSLSRPCALARAMPNLPASIGRGITVAIRHNADNAQRDLASRLLSATGVVEWVEDESLLDAVTALSGSGPAYVFLLAEAMAEAGVAAGLPAQLAERLADETVAGAGALLHGSLLTAAELLEKVTSPGGTTAAALAVLKGKNAFASLMKDAIEAATRRSRELAG